MNFGSRSLAIFLVSGVVPCVYAQRLGAPVRFLETPTPGSGFARDWRNGYLVWFDAYTFSSDPANNLFVYDGQGRLTTKQRIAFPDASSTMVADLDVSPGGQIALAGDVFGGDGEIAGFFAVMPSRGGPATVVKTSPFEARSIAWGPDGTLWLLGMEFGPGRNPKKAAPHATLRQFAPDGRPMRELLHWPEVQCGIHPVDAALQSRVVANGDRIAAYLSTCTRWVEFTPQGDPLGSWTVRPPSGAGPDSAQRPMMHGLVMLPDSQVYVSVGTDIFRLNRSLSAWEAVPQTGKKSYIVGADGALLVVGASDSRLEWVPPQ